MLCLVLYLDLNYRHERVGQLHLEPHLDEVWKLDLRLHVYLFLN